MFGKKILSCIGLLFIGSQISNVAAAVTALDTINDCTAVSEYAGSDCGACTHYCFDGTNIYMHDGSANKVQVGEGVYIFNASGNGVEVANVADGGEYTMYVCDTDKKCGRTFGYVTNGLGLYLKIEKGDVAAADVATDLETPRAAAGCTPGALFTDSKDSTVMLCLAAGKAVEFSGPSNYFMANGGSTIFTSTDTPRMIIQASTSAFILNSVYTDDKFSDCEDETAIMDRKEQFCSGSILNTLYECANGLCTVSAANVGVGKYIVDGKIYDCNAQNVCTATQTGVFAAQKQDPDDETYETVLTDAQVAALTDVSKVHLYDCASGSCTATSGFVKYDTSSKIGQFTDGDYVNTITSQDNSTPGNINLTTKVLSLCVSAGTLKDSTSVGTNVGFLVETKLYKITASIIAEDKQSESYFNSATNKLLVCTTGNCADVSDADGYYWVYDIADSRAKALYLCTASSTCVQQTPGHGYYYNKDASSTSVIVCNTSGCVTVAVADVTDTQCTGHEFKLIYRGGFQYCNDDTEVALASTTPAYYVVADAKSSSVDYPTTFLEVSSGKSIVIEAVKYSVTQYADASPFCIRSNSLIAELSCNNGETKYTCNDATYPCGEQTVAVAECTMTTNDPSRCNGYYRDSTDLKLCNAGVCGEALKLKGYFKSPNGEIIKCTTSDGDTYSCGAADSMTAEAATTAVNNGNEDCTVGTIITGTNVKLCINGKYADVVTIFTTNPDNYFLQASTLYTGKDTNLYYVIGIDTTTVTVKNIPDDITAKKYRYTDATQKLLVKKSGQCTAGNASEFLTEFYNPDESNDTYTKK